MASYKALEGSDVFRVRVGRRVQNGAWTVRETGEGGRVRVSCCHFRREKQLAPRGKTSPDPRTNEHPPSHADAVQQLHNAARADEIEPDSVGFAPPAELNQIDRRGSTALSLFQQHTLYLGMYAIPATGQTPTKK